MRSSISLPYLSIMPLSGRQPVKILVQIDAHHLVGREKTVVDPLPERVGVDRVAEVVDVGNLLGLLGRGGQADLGGGREVFENLAPGRVGGGAAAMALVDDDQIEEVGAELLVDVSLFFGAGHRLIEREVDLIGLVGLPLLDLGHGRAERLEVVGHGLIDQDVAVGQKQDALLRLGLPKPPDDLKGGEGLAGAGGHDQQDAILAAGNGLDGLVDGQQLVIARTSYRCRRCSNPG